MSETSDEMMARLIPGWACCLTSLVIIIVRIALRDVVRMVGYGELAWQLWLRFTCWVRVMVMVYKVLDTRLTCTCGGITHCHMGCLAMSRMLFHLTSVEAVFLQLWKLRNVQAHTP